MNLNPDNFNEVLKKATPRLAYRIDNTLTGEGQLNVELNFTAIWTISVPAERRQSDCPT